MNKNVIEEKCKQVVKLMIERNFQEAYDKDYEKRMLPEIMKQQMDEYGPSFTMTPDNEFHNFTIYKITDDHVSVDCRLWYEGERSDLTTIVELKKFGDDVRWAIVDIHIL